MISPWREWDLTSRSKLISYAESKGIAVPQGKRNDPPFSTDANLLHISYEGWDTPLHIASHVNVASGMIHQLPPACNSWTS